MGGKTLPTRPKHFSNIFGTLPLPRNLLRRVGWKGWKMNFVIFFQRDTLSTLFSFLSSSLDEKYKSSSSSLLQIRRWKLNLVPKDDFQNAFIREKTFCFKCRQYYLLDVVQTCYFLRKIVQKRQQKGRSSDFQTFHSQNAKVFTQLLLSIIRVGLVVEPSFL